MKLKTSFFNPTVYKKNLTRFSPVWIGYSLLLLLYATNILGLDAAYQRAFNIESTIPMMAFVNLCYAFILVQMLFGDMYNSRLCNALHAMPLRRECWFFTNLASCLTFSLVPNALIALIVASFLGSFRILALWWLGAVSLQLLFFLGAALFSAMVVGNRFAMVPVYVLVNFLSMLVYFFALELYEPLMYGIRLENTLNQICAMLSPAVFMIAECTMFHTARIPRNSADYQLEQGMKVVKVPAEDAVYGYFLSEGWAYCAICAAIGVVLGAVALQLYRKRKLEAAGDFLAYNAVKPLFLVLFTLGMGGVFQLFSVVFGVGTQIVFLCAGMVAGYYCCRMLLNRTTRVFQPKSVFGLVAIMAMMGLSLGLTKADVFGVVAYVPQAEEVASVTFSDRYVLNDYVGANITISDPEELEQFLHIHRSVLDEGDTGPLKDQRLSLRYTMKDGSTVERYYDAVSAEGEAGQLLEPYLSSFAYCVGMDESEISIAARNCYGFYYYAYGNDEDLDLNGQMECAEYDIEGLLRAIAADCAAGNMAQEWSYHRGESKVAHLDLNTEIPRDQASADYFSLTIFSGCENTVAWLKANGFSTTGSSILLESTHS